MITCDTCGLEQRTTQQDVSPDGGWAWTWKKVGNGKTDTYLGDGNGGWRKAHQ